MQMQLPEFFIVGDRPVKASRNEEGQMALYAFNWETGEFELAMNYLSRIYFGSGDEVDQVSEDEFEKKVAQLRADLKKKSEKKA